ncbi:hypothetical protein HZS_6588 [Henneguya salminicola]|nr:hypothetical protein HZS_6588 [Henneguya salminicola]
MIPKNIVGGSIDFTQLNKYKIEILSVILNISPIFRADIPTIRKTNWYTSTLEKRLSSMTLASKNINGFNVSAFS